MNIEIRTELCTGCSYCVLGCPSEAITLAINEQTFPVIHEEICSSCGDCLYICPNNVFSSEELTLPPVELDDKYDVVIIGAGIGGLMTAAGLTKAGKKVLVLEQLSFIGGKYTHLMHKGYAITTAAWTCPGPNSRIGKFTKKIGAKIDWITIHDIDSIGEHWIITKDGQRYASTDEAQFNFVGGAKGMEKVYEWISDMYNPRSVYPNDMTARQYIQKFIPENSVYEKYVETIITYCFASQTVDTFSAIETKRAIVDAIEQMRDWGTAIGGTAAIVSGLEEVIIKNGGKIATHTKVASINVKDDKAIGVTLADGCVIKSEIVVHNAGLKRLINLVGESNLPKKYVQRLQSAIPATVAALIIGTNEDLLDDEHSLLHTMGWERTLNCYSPTFFDPKLAPEGKHLLDIFWVMESPINIQHELDIVLDQLRQVFPGFDQIIDMMVPMFFHGYWTAEMAHRIGQSGEQRLDPRSPIENLYLVGYDCIGYGMAGDIIPHGVERALFYILGDPNYAQTFESETTKIYLIKFLKSYLFRLLAWMQHFKQ